LTTKQDLKVFSDCWGMLSDSKKNTILRNLGANLRERRSLKKKRLTAFRGFITSAMIIREMVNIGEDCFT